MLKLIDISCFNKNLECVIFWFSYYEVVIFFLILFFVSILLLVLLLYFQKGYNPTYRDIFISLYDKFNCVILPNRYYNSDYSMYSHSSHILKLGANSKFMYFNKGFRFPYGFPVS